MHDDHTHGGAAQGGAVQGGAVQGEAVDPHAHDCACGHDHAHDEAGHDHAHSCANGGECGCGHDHAHGEADLPDVSGWVTQAQTASCPACGAGGALSLGGGLFCPTCGEVTTNPGYQPAPASDPS